MSSNNRPYVILKAALSLDGYFDDRSETRRVFSSTLDQEAVDSLRANSDAILVGAETLRSDNAKLRIRSKELQAKRVADARPINPRRVTLTASGNLDASLAFFSSETQDSELPIVFCESSAEQTLRETLAEKAEIIALPANASSVLEFILQKLHEAGVRRLLVEGGAQLFAAFLESGKVDQLRIAYAPIFLAAEGAATNVAKVEDLAGLSLSSVEQLEQMSVLTFTR